MRITMSSLTGVSENVFENVVLLAGVTLTLKFVLGGLKRIENALASQKVQVSEDKIMLQKTSSRNLEIFFLGRFFNCFA